MIKQVAHLCFVVKDLAASEEFYCRKLGLAPAFDFINDAGKKFGVYLHAGRGTFIELFVGESQPPTQRDAYRHLCLQVDDLPSEVARLRELGVKVTEPKQGSDHSWQAWLNDPDGLPIELHQYTPQSKQAPWAEV